MEICAGKNGLAPICDAYEKGLPHEVVLNVYLRSIYRAIILGVIESEPVLNGFTGTGCAGNQQMRHLGDISHDGISSDILSDREGKAGFVRFKFIRFK